MDTASYETMYELETKHWWFKARQNIIADMAVLFLPASATKLSIIDVGCGTGANLKMLEQFGAVVGVDYFDQALAFCRAKGLDNVSKEDACTLASFEDNAFDLVTAFDVLEHIDDIQALHAFNRVLRPGGYSILTVPAFQYLWSGHDELAHHLRRYTKADLADRINKTGFRICKMSYFNTFLFPLIAATRVVKARLSKDEESKPDLVMPGNLVNKALLAIFSSERHILKRVNMPIGVSIICLARKKHR